MNLIESYDQILENTQALESARGTDDSASCSDYLSLIKKGRVWFPYLSENGISFGPSRFLGYAKNTVAQHVVRQARDGRVTNKRIEKALRNEFGFPIKNLTDPEMEIQFDKFCASLGVSPDRVNRTFWPNPSVTSWLEEQIEVRINDGDLLPTTKDAIVKARVGQGAFRRQVLQAYGKCLITGIEESSLLIASHIKPWRHCWDTPSECLSPHNALLLSPTWDKLFDRGFISFSDSGQMLESGLLTKKTQEILGLGEISVALSKEQISYMPFHRRIHGFD